ncbi:MAG: ZIP family metal transporter [Erysipelotrichaceae bacterium]|nr:ZIP family metal transporter [Erysipelotrichaceae bacterium]
MEIALIILIPFLGTIIGSAFVYLLKDKINEKVQKILIGFASGVMLAASIWSLLIPSIESSSSMGNLSFIPEVVGFLLGIGFLLLLDTLVPHMHIDSEEPEGLKSNAKKQNMFLFAITLHNIPEGMAVGVVLASAINGSTPITMMAALSLSIGIALQNIPEGAIVSTPLRKEGLSKNKSFIYGILSGIVEPIAICVTIIFSSIITPILPYVLSFAAGAMLYVIVEELIPETQSGKHTNIGTISFAIGFVLMMILDVALG